jgi:hypothetical protein
MESLHHAHQEEQRLRDLLARKQKVAVMLEALAKREEIRVKRIDELRRLIKLKIDSASLASGDTETLQPIDIPPLIFPPWNDQATRTEDALTDLYARHLRHSQPMPSLNDTMKRLEERIGLENAQKCLERARGRVAERLKLQDNELTDTGPSNASLDALAGRVNEAAKKWQATYDKMLALEHSCASRMRSISTFHEETAPSLVSLLRALESNTRGYLDVLVDNIMSLDRDPDASSDTISKEEIQKILGMKGNVVRIVT